MEYNGVMSLNATAAYLKYLRERAGMSQAELARRTYTSSSQINRMEDAKGEVRASLMARIVLVLDANPVDIINLLADEKATEDSGQKLAETRYRQRSEASNGLPIAVRPEIVSLASQMSEFQLGKWVALGEKILKE